MVSFNGSINAPNGKPGTVSGHCMMTITDKNIIEFYKFLNGETSLLEMEAFVYDETDLAQQLSKDIYSELINFDFKDKHSSTRLRNFIVQYIAPEGQFETWKPKSLLEAFLTGVNNIHTYLHKLYHLYCDVYQGNEHRIYG